MKTTSEKGIYMFGIQNYTSFILAIILFQLIPGAGTVTILNATARNGIGTGMSAVIGTLLGDFIYMSAAVLGLAAVLAAYPGVLQSAQWIGVIYLGWMGLKLLWVSASDPAKQQTKQPGVGAYFRQALAVSLTNPKVIMFFMAFFPLFLSAESGPVTLFILMIHVTTISLIYQTCLVLLGNAAAQRLAKWPLLKKLATRMAGIALIGFGLKLAFSIRR